MWLRGELEAFRVMSLWRRTNKNAVRRTEVDREAREALNQVNLTEEWHINDKLYAS